ncbi:MAG: hypothetical protein P8Z49_00480, partial [Acidobacteriota bacterium]
RSWDSFLVPLPFSRVVFVYGKPIHVPRDADADELERCRMAVERGLNEAAAEAESALSRGSLWKA